MAKKKTQRAVKKPQANAAKNKAPAGKRGTQKKATAAKSSPPAKPSIFERLKKLFKRKPKKRKNVSQNVPNGVLVISNDKYFYGTDEKSNKTRMSTVVDSNRNDELAITKYTTSSAHGRKINNSQGFKNHGDKIYTLDNEGKPIKIDNKKFVAKEKRKITEQQANEIKRHNVTESRYKKGNKANLRNMKGRAKKRKK